MISCQPGDDGAAEPTGAGQRAESHALGLSLDGIPDTWTIQDAEALRLTPTGEVQGEIWIEIDHNIFNLVQAVNDWKERYEAMPDGRFLGQLELGTQLGPAYTVRGRYTHEGANVEERRIITLHPGGVGLSHMVYRYPGESDSKARGQEMFGLFGGLEPLASEVTSEEP
jgi:hypothetical protein